MSKMVNIKQSNINKESNSTRKRSLTCVCLYFTEGKNGITISFGLFNVQISSRCWARATHDVGWYTRWWVPVVEFTDRTLFCFRCGRPRWHVCHANDEVTKSPFSNVSVCDSNTCNGRLLSQINCPPPDLIQIGVCTTMPVKIAVCITVDSIICHGNEPSGVCERCTLGGVPL